VTAMKRRQGRGWRRRQRVRGSQPSHKCAAVVSARGELGKLPKLMPTVESSPSTQNRTSGCVEGGAVRVLGRKLGREPCPCSQRHPIIFFTRTSGIVIDRWRNTVDGHQGSLLHGDWSSTCKAFCMRRAQIRRSEPTGGRRSRRHSWRCVG